MALPKNLALIVAPSGRLAEIRGDKASATTAYYGWAEPNSLTSDPAWRIIRVTYDGSGNFTALEWADGESTFTNVWDDRASLVY